MNEVRLLIQNTGIIAVGGMATKLVQFLLLPLYTSVLSTSEYGVVDYINTIVLFCVPAVSLLMDEAMFRFLIDCQTDEERRGVVTCSCAALLGGSCVFVFASLVVWVFLRPDNLVWVAILVFSQALLQMTAALLRGLGQTTAYALMNFIASLSAIIMNVTFIAVFRWGIAGMLSATAIAQGVTAAAFLFIKKVWQYLDIRLLDYGYLLSLIRYSLPLIPNKVSWTIMNMVDRLIIMNCMGASAAGVYAVSYKFPNVVDQVYGFFYQSWKESSARALGSEGDEVAFYNTVHRILRRLLTSAVLVMIALIPLVYGVLVGGSYGEGMLYVPILLLATYYSNISGFYGGIFIAHRDTRIMGITTAASALLCLALCLVLIPFIGLWGASVSTLAATISVNEYRLAKVRAYADLDRDLRGRFFAAFALVAVFALYYFYCFTGARIALVLCVISAFTYSGFANNAVAKRLLSAARSATRRKKD